MRFTNVRHFGGTLAIASRSRYLSNKSVTNTRSFDPNQHTSHATDSELVCHIDIALLQLALVLLNFGYHILITLPDAATHWARHISRATLCLGPHSEACLVDVLTTGCSAPDDGFLLAHIKFAVANGAVSFDGLALVRFGLFWCRNGRRRSKDALKLGTDQGELVDKIKRCIQNLLQDLRI